MSAVSQPPGRAALADDVQRRCRAGLGAAAGALYAGAPAATASALRDRLEAGASLWPWLPGLCYRALEPVDVAFPEHDRAMAVAGKALLGRAVRAERLAEAVRQLRGQAPAVAAADAPDPELAAAVERFWDQLARLAQHLGKAVRAGDEATVQQALQQATARLRKSAAAMRTAAEHAVARLPQGPSREAGQDPAVADEGVVARNVGDEAVSGVEPPAEQLPAAQPLAGASAGPDAPSGPEAHDTRDTARIPLSEQGVWPPADPGPGGWSPADPGPGASPPREPEPGARVPARPEVGGRVVEEGGELEPDRPYAPLVFVGGALLLAVVLLAAVATGVVAL